MTRTLRQAAEDYERAAGGGLLEAMRRTLIGVALMGEAQARENATSSPKVRSGHLRRSISSETTLEASRVVLTLRAGEGATERYASAQEYGATVRPRRGKFLAIPVGRALTGAGVPRYPSPRAVPGLRFVPIRGGSMGLLVKDVGKRNARSDTYFILLRSVRVPATRYIGRALDSIRPVAADRLADSLRVVLEGV